MKGLLNEVSSVELDEPEDPNYPLPDAVIDYGFDLKNLADTQSRSDASHSWMHTRHIVNWNVVLS